MKLIKNLPRTYDKFKVWIEGPAFGDVMDTGDVEVIELMNIHTQYGTQVSFYLFCAMWFIQDYGLAIGVNEARYIYYEGAVIDVPEDRNDIRDPCIKFCTRMANLQAWDDNSCYEVSKPPIKLVDRSKTKNFIWRFLPNITNNGEKISLANYLMHSIVMKYPLENTLGTETIPVKMSCEVFLFRKYLFQALGF